MILIPESRYVIVRGKRRLNLIRREGQYVRLLLEDEQGRPASFADLSPDDMEHLLISLKRSSEESKRLQNADDAAACNYRWYNKIMEKSNDKR